jgi:hypothetical protein
MSIPKFKVFGSYVDAHSYLIRELGGKGRIQSWTEMNSFDHFQPIIQEYLVFYEDFEDKKESPRQARGSKVEA